MPHLIKIIDLNSNSTLYSFRDDECEIAFNKARELEELGLDIKIVTPTSIETLGVALGADHQALEKVSCEIKKEIESHN
jgi:hypothetical protein